MPSKIKGDTIKIMKKILLATFLFSFFIFGQVQAAGLVPCGGTGESACQFCHIFVLINTILQKLLFVFVPVIAVLMLIFGGVMFFFAGANPRLFSQATGIIKSVVIGLVIIFAAWMIVNTVISQIGLVDSPSLLQWYKIDCPVQ